ncbi:MAG: hypothetical protein UX80_C0031G0010 [Candidatus Amesbacteria bacterium GW2011_GWA2_47_11b]|uniref:DUF5673 domain-containing protein n=3 Tax=Candidatus Amesiibacteriota TaxID=1752730 RepID=A0A0G1SEQ2_9BACT|nr:MAG: hypothetical protein UX42_C0029G0003 [Microgenomates group bacterium GW2011_GWC1_46_20]KKU56814.1 MAG: hypothetical protein UX80_C0031G0010 [Candidatus Amesbacteria bacterium GW2011_GWA2_47_11b]KKU67907.1 MAG: hypothetical protein UX92_C0027G0003 [Candidatus Amesbacteria bacterium GW2011_GWA1_47_20]KKU82430.1 MAG: hypothetical protein UY11_C0048G0008 [Candidatus Amesbacteria bacterium GW2011_GWC2_47_8]
MDPAQPQIEQERELVKWIAAERPYKPLDRQMFVTGVVVAILVGVIMLLAGEFMAVLVLAAVIFAYYVWSTVSPQQVEYVITTRGIRMSGRLYTWVEMTRWWMGEKWGSRLLTVETPTSWPKRLHLVLGAEEEAVKGVMEKYVLMEKPVETSMDRAGKWLAEKFPLQAR